MQNNSFREKKGEFKILGGVEMGKGMMAVTMMMMMMMAMMRMKMRG